MPAIWENQEPCCKQTGYEQPKIVRDLTDAASSGESTLDEIEPGEQEQSLMQILDQVNERFAAGTLRYAASGLQQGWKMTAARRSPRYVTSWKELAIARADNSNTVNPNNP